MRVTVDGGGIVLNGGASDLEGILEEVLAAQGAEGRVISSVALNGEEYTERFSRDARNVTLEAHDSLEIRTMGQAGIFREFTQNSRLIVDQLQQGAQRISELLRVADAQEANTHFAHLLESCRDLFLMLNIGEQAFGLRFSHMVVAGARLGERLDSTGNLLDRIAAAQEDEDWVMLADLLEFPGPLHSQNQPAEGHGEQP